MKNKFVDVDTLIKNCKTSNYLTHLFPDVLWIVEDGKISRMKRLGVFPYLYKKDLGLGFHCAAYLTKRGDCKVLADISPEDKVTFADATFLNLSNCLVYYLREKLSSLSSPQSQR